MAADVAAMPRTGEEKTPGYAWVILIVVFLASFTVPVNFFKVPTIAPVLIEQFNMGDNFGWMMSMFTFISILLSFPAAGLAKKFGMRIVTIVSISAAIAGGLIGVFAVNMPMLLFGRFLEGLCMGFFGVIAPAMITQWFPRKTVGLAAGIWSIWMPAGGAVMSAVVPIIFGATNSWQVVWWVAIFYSAIALVLFLVFYRVPPDMTKEALANRSDEEREAAKGGFKRAMSLSIIFIGIAFVIYNLCNNGTVNTYLPLYLQDKSIDMQTAGLIAALQLALAIVANALGGFVSDRLGTRKWPMVFGFAALMVGTWMIFDFGGSVPLLLGGVLIAGLFPGAVSACATAAIPELIPNKEDQGYGMAMLGFGAGVGSFIGGLALGWLNPVFGSWEMAAHVLLVPLILIGIVATLFVKVR
ncbi:MAG: MFS transporter [Coriobacteriales bacterium]|jgi:NNP family nitrate/nitrite transporter-like MFS transporter|nr:MFS transporter [Coriobacteriales bacterium]